MRYRPLGHTDMMVSEICLGTMTWGVQNSFEDAAGQLDFACDHGINFIDTAEMYPVPPSAETHGKTEEILGQWLKARGHHVGAGRDRLIIATKVVGGARPFDYVRGGAARLDRPNIEAAVDASLTRLGLDHIDLYQLHWPDRGTNFFGQRGFRPDPALDEAATPLAETLAVLKDLMATGKIRSIGLSNETPWGAMTCLRLATTENLPKPVAIQNAYNLLNRTYEAGLAEVSYRESCGLLAYAPVGGGALTGKYSQGAVPDGSRLDKFGGRFSRYRTPHADAAIDRYVALARKYDLDPAQMAIAFILQQPFVTSAIVGATSMAQLTGAIAAKDCHLTQEVLDGIAQIYEDIPDPCP